MASSLGPAHAFWPLIRRRVAPGSPLFPSVNRRNFNRTPRAALPKIQEPSADRFISHGCRRGTSQDLKEPGSPWSVVATSGIWHSPAFRGYVDMSRDVEMGAQKLFDVDLDSDSAEEDPVHFVFDPGKPWAGGG